MGHRLKFKGAQIMTSQNHQESTSTAEAIFSTLDQMEKTLDTNWLPDGGRISIDGKTYLFDGDAAKSILLELKEISEREAIQAIDKRFDRLERMIKIVFCCLILPPPAADPKSSYIPNGFQAPADSFLYFEKTEKGKKYQDLLEELLQIDKYLD